MAASLRQTHPLLQKNTKSPKPQRAPLCVGFTAHWYEMMPFMPANPLAAKFAQWSSDEDDDGDLARYITTHSLCARADIERHVLFVDGESRSPAFGVSFFSKEKKKKKKKSGSRSRSALKKSAARKLDSSSESPLSVASPEPVSSVSFLPAALRVPSLPLRSDPTPPVDASVISAPVVAPSLLSLPPPASAARSGRSAFFVCRTPFGGGGVALAQAGGEERGPTLGARIRHRRRPSLAARHEFSASFCSRALVVVSAVSAVDGIGRYGGGPRQCGGSSTRSDGDDG